MKYFLIILYLHVEFFACAQAFFPLSSGTQTTLGSIYFEDDNNGHTVGYNGVVLTTTNGGLNWMSQSSGVATDLCDVVRQNGTSIIVGRSGVILRSVNGGVNWNLVPSGVINDLTRVYINGNDIYVTGYNGVILKSTDNGLSFSQLNSNST